MQTCELLEKYTLVDQVPLEGLFNALIVGNHLEALANFPRNHQSSRPVAVARLDAFVGMTSWEKKEICRLGNAFLVFSSEQITPMSEGN